MTDRRPKRTPPPPYEHSAQEREQALEIARVHGATEAARRTGKPRSTIARWLKEERKKKPAEPAPDDEFAKERASIAKAQRTADMAIKRLEEIIPKSNNVHHLSVNFGVMLDKADKLREKLEAAEERRAVLSEETQQILIMVIQHFSEGVDIPLEGPVYDFFSDLLRRVESWREIHVIATDPQLGAAAAATIRQRVGGQLHDVIERQVFEKLAPQISEVRGLPGPGDTAASEPGELAESQKVWSHAEARYHEHLGSPEQAEPRLAADVARERERADRKSKRGRVVGTKSGSAADNWRRQNNADSEFA